MGLPRVTITAPMFAPAIGIEAGIKRDVGTVVVTDDRLGEIPQELGFWRRVLLRVPIDVPFQGDLVKPIGRIACRASTARRWRFAGHGLIVLQNPPTANASLFPLRLARDAFRRPRDVLTLHGDCKALA